MCSGHWTLKMMFYTILFDTIWNNFRCICISVKLPFQCFPVIFGMSSVYLLISVNFRVKLQGNRIGREGCWRFILLCWLILPQFLILKPFLRNHSAWTLLSALLHCVLPQSYLYTSRGQELSLDTVEQSICRKMYSRGAKLWKLHWIAAMISNISGFIIL